MNIRKAIVITLALLVSAPAFGMRGITNFARKARNYSVATGAVAYSLYLNNNLIDKSVGLYGSKNGSSTPDKDMVALCYAPHLGDADKYLKESPKGDVLPYRSILTKERLLWMLNDKAIKPEKVSKPFQFCGYNIYTPNSTYVYRKNDLHAQINPFLWYQLQLNKICNKSIPKWDTVNVNCDKAKKEIAADYDKASKKVSDVKKYLGKIFKN